MQSLVQQILFIIFSASMPFLFSLNGDFVFDDSEAIVKNKDVISTSWLDPFNNDFWGTDIKSNLSHKSYRPLTILSFRLNYYFNGKNLSATQFKVTNLVCHILCCILVWMTYKCIWNKVKMKNHLTNGVNLPFISAVIFSVHPIHVEAICGIVGRADLLATAAFLSSFLIYNKALKDSKLFNIYLFASIILAGTSMLFKENGITVLGVCCVYDLILHINSKSQERLKNKLLIYKNFNVEMKSIYRIICLVIFTMLFLYGRWIIMGASKPEFKVTDNPAAFSDNFFTRISTYSYIYFLNVTLLVWPQWLSYDWSMGCIPLIRNEMDYRIVFVLMFYIHILIFIKKLFNKTLRTSSKRIMIMGCALIVIPFLPAANIIYPVGFVIAERILYIPSIGYCLLISVGANKIIQCKVMCSKKILVIIFGLILIYALRSCQRSFHWQNEYQLFTSALSVCPLNAKVHYNIAKVADVKNNTEWALEEYKEAIRLYPEYYQAMNNLANLLKNQKKFEEAEFHLRNAIHFKKEFPAAWMNLGIVLANTKRYEESKSAYKTALLYRRHYPDCYYNLGNLYLEMNESQKAMENWYHAVNLNSKHVSAWTNLLALLDNTGQTDKALHVIPKVLTELSETPSINFAIANIYGKIDLYADAEKHFLKAIKLFKTRVQAIHYANLGVLYHRWRRYELAEEMYNKALELDPNFHSASRNLQNLYKIKKKIK